MSYLDNLFSLDGKVAVAIGAGGVLAGAMADALGAAGARVAVLDLNGEAADERAESIRKASGVEALGMAIDATSEKDLRKAVGQVLSLWGRVDILLNAPGINSGTPFFEITEEEWDRILFKGLHLLDHQGRGQ